MGAPVSTVNTWDRRPQDRRPPPAGWSTSRRS